MRRAFLYLALLAAAPAAAQVSAPSTAQAVAPAAEQAAPAASPALRSRVQEIVAILNGGGNYATTFSPAFRAQVPAEKFDTIIKQLTGVGGKVIGVESIAPTRPDAATVRLTYERGTATLRVAVDSAEPHHVIGLLFNGIEGREASLDAVVTTLAGLPGTTAFAAAKLGTGGPSLVTAHNADRALAIGSEFKLVILATLVREIDDGKRHWTDTVTLDGTPRPAGTYMFQPRGTKVTLRALADKMISISDNSATDILLEELGREKVEAMMPVVGIADPARVRPFLSTAEVFKLKGVPGLAERYLALDEDGRRAMLAGEVASTPLTAIPATLFADGKPVRIEQLEWFLSPADVVRTLDWLRRHSETGPAAEARAVLSINPALPPASAAAWRYVGYKGGSEPGVMAMSWLLQAKDGGWYAVSGTWNNPQAGVDEAQFLSLMTRAAALAGQH